jgi:(2Fe-2S) ferredoxin
LAGDHAERTWECTHLGGHRFAGNLVLLPDGIVYGRVSPADGPRVADAYLERRLDLDLLRGRSAWPPPAQVAERVLRHALRVDGVDDVRLLDVSATGDGAEVRLAGPEGTERTFRLRAERAEPPRPISCRADELESPLHWIVQD